MSSPPAEIRRPPQPALHPGFYFGPCLRENPITELSKVTIEGMLAAPIQDYRFCLAIVETAAEASFGQMVFVGGIRGIAGFPFALPE